VRLGSRFARTRAGDFKLRLDPAERALLAALPDQLAALLSGASSNGAAVRLFPPAYVSDAARDDEYQRLMRSELVRRRLEALEVVRGTLDAPRLTVSELDAWVRVFNDVRLVLGTVIDVSEEQDPLDVDPGAPDIGERWAYVVLSAIVADAVDALTGTLPPPSAVEP
jgi:hypothetical protein